jgi:hypothetical protein
MGLGCARVSGQTRSCGTGRSMRPFAPPSVVLRPLSGLKQRYTRLPLLAARTRPFESSFSLEERKP